MAVKLLKRIQSWFGALFQRWQLDADMDEEMRAHVEMRTRENILAGKKHTVASQAERLGFGWTEGLELSDGTSDLQKIHPITRQSGPCYFRRSSI
jgi:hypothetical protein